MSKQAEIAGIEERLVLLTNKLNALKEANILETDASVKFRYDTQIAEVEREINKEKETLTLLQTKEKNFSSKSTTIKFPLHHQYTCDRIDQDGVFMDYVTNPANISKRLHFFYLHGSRKQEHLGLYKRFCNTLAGRNRTLGAEQEEAIKVLPLEFVYPKDRTKERIQVNIALEIIEKLGIKEADLENTSARNLAYALQNSPKLQGLYEKDKVCCFIRIPSRRWNKELTPEMTLWFIEQFCLRELPPSIPEFFFFFSVDYKEDDQQTKEGLVTAMENSKHTLLFPELTMVEKEDVEDWFDDYKTYWKDDRVQEKIMDQHFADKVDEMYMADVQDILKNIIDNINQSEKDVPRNS